MNSSDDGSLFLMSSVYVLDNPRIEHIQHWVSLAVRLLEHHEEFAKTCCAAGSSVFKALAGLSLLHHARQVAIEAVGREDYDTATCGDADQRDALFPNPRRFGWGGQRHRQRRERQTPIGKKLRQ